MSLRRIVAIEFGMCRSGRNGGSSGSVTVGYGRVGGKSGGKISRGGNRLLFGDQESVRRDAHRGMMVEATPPASFVVPEPDLLLELLIIALDAPPQLGGVDQIAEGVVSRRGREPILVRLFLALGPLHQQPLFDWFPGPLVARCNMHTHT